MKNGIAFHKWDHCAKMWEECIIGGVLRNLCRPDARRHRWRWWSKALSAPPISYSKRQQTVKAKQFCMRSWLGKTPYWWIFSVCQFWLPVLWPLEFGFGDLCFPSFWCVSDKMLGYQPGHQDRLSLYHLQEKHEKKQVGDITFCASQLVTFATHIL